MRFPSPLSRASHSRRHRLLRSSGLYQRGLVDPDQLGRERPEVHQQLRDCEVALFYDHRPQSWCDGKLPRGGLVEARIRLDRTPLRSPSPASGSAEPPETTHTHHHSFRPPVSIPYLFFCLFPAASSMGCRGGRVGVARARGGAVGAFTCDCCSFAQPTTHASNFVCAAWACFSEASAPTDCRAKSSQRAAHLQVYLARQHLLCHPRGGLGTGQGREVGRRANLVSRFCISPTAAAVTCSARVDGSVHRMMQACRACGEGPALSQHSAQHRYPCFCIGRRRRRSSPSIMRSRPSCSFPIASAAIPAPSQPAPNRRRRRRGPPIPLSAPLTATACP